MNLEYRHSKEWIEKDYIQRLIDVVKSEKDYFLVLARILSLYNTPDFNNETKQERIEDIQDLILTKDSLSNKPQDEIDHFKFIIEELYQEVSDTLDKTRGKILEAIVYYFGPHSFSCTPVTNRYVEPQIYDGTILVGITDHVMDIIFNDTSARADYIECKASIHNFIDLVKNPLRMRSKKKRRKWKYIKEVYDYLSQKGFYPNFIIASFSNEVSDYQQKLKDSNFDFVTILNDEDLYNMIS